MVVLIYNYDLLPKNTLIVNSTQLDPTVGIGPQKRRPQNVIFNDMYQDISL